MKYRFSALFAAGLLLLALAAALVPGPRLHPRPDLPELPPFVSGDRVALVLPAPADFPPPDSFALVRRARAAGAEVRVFSSGDSFGTYAPTRIFQPPPGPCIPAGYHPDQWPAFPPGDATFRNEALMLVLAPEERSRQNAAVLAAAHALRDSGIDDRHGTREAALLSRARRAEIWLPLD